MNDASGTVLPLRSLLEQAIEDINDYDYDGAIRLIKTALQQTSQSKDSASDKVRRVRAEALRLCEAANAIGADGRGIDAFRLAQRDELRDYARHILDIVGVSDEGEKEQALRAPQNDDERFKLWGRIRAAIMHGFSNAPIGYEAASANAEWATNKIMEELGFAE